MSDLKSQSKWTKIETYRVPNQRVRSAKYIIYPALAGVGALLLIAVLNLSVGFVLVPLLLLYLYYINIDKFI